MNPFLEDRLPEVLCYPDAVGVAMGSVDGQVVRLCLSGEEAPPPPRPLRGVTPVFLLQTMTRQIAGVSHDIGGGLTSVLAAMDILDDLGSAEEHADMKAALCEQIQSISALMKARRMLAFPLYLEREPVDVRGVTEDVVQTFHDISRVKSVQLRLNNMDNIPVISADPGVLQCTIGHLLLNAIEASEPGMTILLETREFRERGLRWLTVSVLDGGRGLPKERLGSLGEPGAFASHHRAGLGLFAAAQGAAALGGVLWLTERRPRGTEAHLVLRL